MGRNRHRPGTGLMAGGLLLLAAALLLTGYNLIDQWRADRAAAAVLERMPEPAELPAPSAGPGEQEIPDYLLNPDMEPPTVEIDGTDYLGTLDIPCLGLSLPVMSEWSDARLKTTPCRYAGTAYKSGFVIAGHNYRGHFGSLYRLAPGDEVQFTDAVGNVFSYGVSEIQELPGTALEEMEAGDWDLTLFTCTLSRTSRVTVRCERTGETE